MIPGDLTLITYVWHYLVARVVYDQLLRPALHGRLMPVLLIFAVAASGFLVGLWAGRHRPRQAASSRRRT